MVSMVAHAAVLLATCIVAIQAQNQPQQFSTCTATSGKYTPRENCFDKYDYIGADGYPCAAWRADDCSTADDPAATKANCPFACGVCTPGKCQDNANYVDPAGYNCADWADFECGLAAEYFDYSITQEVLLIQNCPLSCNFCGDRSDKGCSFPFDLEGEKQSRCVFDTDEGLEWCRGTQLSKITGEALWKVCVPAGTQCIFPFKHLGQLYDTCVPEDGIAWCATKVDGDLRVVDGHWGVCDCNMQTDVKRIEVVTTQATTVTTSTQTHQRLVTMAEDLPDCGTTTTTQTVTTTTKTATTKTATTKTKTKGPVAIDWTRVYFDNAANNAKDMWYNNNKDKDKNNKDKNNKDKDNKDKDNKDKDKNYNGMGRRERGTAEEVQAHLESAWAWFTPMLGALEGGQMCIPNGMEREQFSGMFVYQPQNMVAFVVNKAFFDTTSTTTEKPPDTTTGWPTPTPTPPPTPPPTPYRSQVPVISGGGVEVNLKAVDEGNGKSKAAALDGGSIALIVIFGVVLLVLGGVYQQRKRSAAYSYESLLANITSERASGTSSFYDSTVAEHLEHLELKNYVGVGNMPTNPEDQHTQFGR